MCDFRYTFSENVILEILKLIYTKDEIEEWLELPREGSTTFGTSVSSTSKQFPSLYVVSMASWVQPERSVGFTDLSQS